MGLKSVIPKTFKKAPDALLFFKCGMMGLRKSITVKQISKQQTRNVHATNARTFFIPTATKRLVLMTNYAIFVYQVNYHFTHLTNTVRMIQ